MAMITTFSASHTIRVQIPDEWAKPQEPAIPVFWTWQDSIGGPMAVLFVWDGKLYLPEVTYHLGSVQEAIDFAKESAAAMELPTWFGCEDGCACCPHNWQCDKQNAI